MSKEFLLKDLDVAQKLNITQANLLKIRTRLHLVPQQDFIKLTRTESCFFTASGIKKLYSALNGHPPFRGKAKLLKELVLEVQERVLHANIRQTVLENSQIVKLGTRNFLPENKVAAILRVTVHTLNNVLELTKETNPLIHYDEFRRLDGVTYYSFSGINKLSDYLAQHHKSPSTRKWCQNVVLHTELIENDPLTNNDSRVSQAMKQAKKRDDNTCQITQEKITIDNQFNLAVHHLYDQIHYPHLADSLDNLLTIKESIHKEFHQYMGGTSKPCTIDDLIKFVQLAYPQYPDALNVLHRFRTRLYAPYAPKPLMPPSDEL